jgi:transposase
LFNGKNNSASFAMLKEPTPRQPTLEMVILEDLVPADHLLRKLDKYIDFEFIRDKVRHLYCGNNGRPAVDPVLLFKMLFIGYWLSSPQQKGRLFCETTICF